MGGLRGGGSRQVRENAGTREEQKGGGRGGRGGGGVKKEKRKAEKQVNQTTRKGTPKTHAPKPSPINPKAGPPGETSTKESKEKRSCELKTGGAM